MKIFELRGRNVASSKNGKMIVRGRLINNKLSQDYYKFVLPILEEMKDNILAELEHAELPAHFHFYYYRKDRRHFDYANVVQILADAFQKVEILEDDDADHFIPVFEGYEVDGENPGVKFWID